MAPDESSTSKVEHTNSRALKSAKNRRAVAISQIERAAEFEKRVAADVSLTFLEELQIRIQALDEAFTSFKTEQWNIEDLDPDEFQNEERAKYEEMYFATVASLKSIQQKLNSSKASALDSTPKDKFDHVRLPEINLPTFTGDITTWITWFETFSAIIDTNPNLSSLSKFHYLIARLSPSARAPIAGIKIEAENYEDALKILKERYENKKVIAQEHILRIFNYPRLHRSSAVEIRALMDNINNHLNCLRNLERPVDQWDDIIVTIVLFKLDPSSLAGWNEAAPVDRLPTLSELFEFLKKRCLKVEGFSLAQQNTSIFPHNHLNPKLFGQPSIPAFGAAPPFNHGSLFGQAQSTSSASFGSIGQSNQSSLFGSSTTAFGQPTGGTGTATNATTSKSLEVDNGLPKDIIGQSSMPAFGAPKISGFGCGQTAAESTTSLFGQTLPSSAASSSATSANSGTGTLTGQAQPTSTPRFGLFGKSTFGQPTASASSATGTLTSVAQPITSLFGQSQPTKRSSFGDNCPKQNGFPFHTGETKPTSTFACGSLSQINQPTFTFGNLIKTTAGTTLVKYHPTIGTDKLNNGDSSTNVNTKHHCITAMKEYESKSLEELRMEDNFGKQKVKPIGLFGQPENKSTKPLGFAGLTGARLCSSGNDNKAALEQSPSCGLNKTEAKPAKMNSSVFNSFNQKPLSTFTFKVANLDGYKLYGTNCRENTKPLPSASKPIVKELSSNSKSETSVPIALQESNKSKNETAAINANTKYRQRSKSFSGIIAQKFKDETTRYRELGLYPHDFTKVYQHNHLTM